MQGNVAAVLALLANTCGVCCGTLLAAGPITSSGLVRQTHYAHREPNELSDWSSSGWYSLMSAEHTK